MAKNVNTESPQTHSHDELILLESETVQRRKGAVVRRLCGVARKGVTSEINKEQKKIF
jgi:hypothetical protein